MKKSTENNGALLGMRHVRIGGTGAAEAKADDAE